jgi:hypothetical protein
MAYMQKRNELEAGEVYIIEFLSSPRRKDPGHWHNSYYVTTEKKSGHVELYMINKGEKPRFSTSGTIKNKLYSKVTDKPRVKHNVIKYIFE